ncbi:MAG: hypothetical protein ACREKN_07055 [Longimicrobiaceae bacterium]
MPCRVILGGLLPFLITLASCGNGDAAGAKGVVAAPERLPGGGTVHLVRVAAGGEEPGFLPSRVTLRAGDAIRFVNTSRHPEAVGFDPARVPAGSYEALARQGAFHPPLLVNPGDYFQLSFEGALPGRYRFHSLAGGVAGTAIVTE